MPVKPTYKSSIIDIAENRHLVGSGGSIIKSRSARKRGPGKPVSIIKHNQFQAIGTAQDVGGDINTIWYLDRNSMVHKYNPAGNLLGSLDISTIFGGSGTVVGCGGNSSYLILEDNYIPATTVELYDATNFPSVTLVHSGPTWWNPGGSWQDANLGGGCGGDENQIYGVGFSWGSKTNYHKVFSFHWAGTRWEADYINDLIVNLTKPELFPTGNFSGVFTGGDSNVVICAFPNPSGEENEVRVYDTAGLNILLHGYTEAEVARDKWPDFEISQDISFGNTPHSGIGGGSDVIYTIAQDQNDSSWWIIRYLIL